MSDISFPKAEHLCKRKDIETLLKQGTSLLAYPYKVTFLTQSEVTYSQVLISVPKRGFKKAVERNLVKRRTREAYRLQKLLLLETPSFVGWIQFHYVAKQVLTFEELKKGMLKALKKIKEAQV